MSLQMMTPFALLYLARGVDFTYAPNELRLRLLYVGSQVVQAIVLFLVYRAIQSRNDQTEITLTDGSKQSIRDYDLASIKQTASGSFTGILFMAFLHLQMKAVVPLFFQAWIGLFNLWSLPLARDYLWAESPLQFPELQRPFPKPKSPFAAISEAFGGGGEEDTPPAAAVAAAASNEQPVERVEVLDEEGDGPTEQTDVDVD